MLLGFLLCLFFPLCFVPDFVYGLVSECNYQYSPFIFLLVGLVLRLEQFPCLR